MHWKYKSFITSLFQETDRMDKKWETFLTPLMRFVFVFLYANITNPDNCLYRYSVALGAMNEYTWHAIYEPTKMIKFEKEIFKIDLKSNMLWCIMKSELFVLLRMLTYVYIKAKSIYIPWNDAG